MLKEILDQCILTRNPAVVILFCIKAELRGRIFRLKFIIENFHRKGQRIVDWQNNFAHIFERMDGKKFNRNNALQDGRWVFHFYQLNETAFYTNHASYFSLLNASLLLGVEEWGGKRKIQTHILPVWRRKRENFAYGNTEGTY